MKRFDHEGREIIEEISYDDKNNKKITTKIITRGRIILFLINKDSNGDEIIEK